MFRLLTVGAGLSGVLAGPGLTAEDCKSIHIPTDESSKLPLFTVRYDTNLCIVECDVNPAGSNTPVLGCTAFSDSVNAIMTKAGLMPATCYNTMFEAPDKEPGSTDPEIILAHCPDFMLYLGWDRNMTRTLGHMRQELALETQPALEAFKAAMPHAKKFDETSAPSSLTSQQQPTEADCTSIHPPTDETSHLPLFTVRYSDQDKQCTVECDMHRAGSSEQILGCAAFSDAIDGIMSKAGLKPDTCLKTMLEQDMLVIGCPEFTYYGGWDRALSKTLGNMRQEVALKSMAAVQAVVKGFTPGLSAILL